ncbi:hypothetical protein [Magnetofaba australis]|uniref:Uncharacterized protein n=1 Tax=Magnetofaba australis IT-1 TaxID=1434232 RepID=A0A1Y2K9Q3_9PROT|nr:hypothetical protein [Magnetofaba australis]OSM07343.1 hypothetical protein MAIT1_04438 [Magnetofaba australis IT-1]
MAACALWSLTPPSAQANALGCSPCEGFGAVATQLDDNPKPDLAYAWVAQGKGYYGVSANLANERSGEAERFNKDGKMLDYPPVAWKPLGDIPGATAGVGLAAGKIDQNAAPDLLFAWLDEKGGIHYRVGMDADANGVAAWSDAISAPGQVVGKSRGLGAAMAELTGNARPELVVAWGVVQPDGKARGYYRVGFDLDEKGAAKSWSEPFPVANGAALNTLGVELKGVGLTLENVDLNYALDLIFSWSASAKGTGTLLMNVGLNLDAQGRARGWSDKVTPLPMVAIGGAGAGLASARVDNKPQPDFIAAWGAPQGFPGGVREYVALNQEPVPAYQPTEADLNTQGDETTGLSRASVNTQIAKGIYSPAMLEEYVRAHMTDTPIIPEQIEQVNRALDALAVDDTVRGELEALILQRLGIQSGAL